VCDHVKGYGLTPHVMHGPGRCVVGVLGHEGRLSEAGFTNFEGVIEVVRVYSPYVLSSRETHPADTVVSLGDGVKFGASEVVVIAGPCSVESLEQAIAVARTVKAAGATVLRGGLFKPRTSPFSFQGLGEAGYDLMDEVRRETGLKFVTEALDERSLELAEARADIDRIGARNMQNFALLKKVGRCKKPVLLKRGFSATLDELLMAADYILAGGNYNVVLCERGIRTFTDHSRNTLDLSAVPMLKQLSHLPVIVDPSHATGKRKLVQPMALAAVAAGADGVMLEVHCSPAEALSDGEQALLPQDFESLVPRMAAVAQAVGRTLHTASPLNSGL